MQNFGTFVKNYKPLRFKFGGIKMTEHMPRLTMFETPQLLRIRIKRDLGLKFTYFDFRPSLTPEGKKRADMALLTYFIRKRDTDAENAPRSVKWYFRWLYLCYFPELYYINPRIGTKEVDNYMLRWGYLLDHDPSFNELIHGTDAETASQAIESLV